MRLQPGQRKNGQHILEEAKFRLWAKTSLGKAAFYKGEHARAQQLFREVINENPAYLEAHDWLAKVSQGGSSYSATWRWAWLGVTENSTRSAGFSE